MTRPTTRRRRRRWERTFLAALETSPVVAMACRAAGISRQAAYAWRAESPEFAREWDDAIEEALDAVEAVVIRLAVEDEDPQTARWILSRRRPATWGDREKIEVSGPGGGPVETVNTHHTHKPDAATWAEIIRIREGRSEAEDQGAAVGEAVGTEGGPQELEEAPEGPA